jgi:uncharacterized protein (TIGR03435 family)
LGQSRSQILRPESVAQGQSVLEAVKKQLGLKLSPEKGTVEWIIIDHIEQPTAN